MSCDVRKKPAFFNWPLFPFVIVYLVDNLTSLFHQSKFVIYRNVIVPLKAFIFIEPHNTYLLCVKTKNIFSITLQLFHFQDHTICHRYFPNFPGQV